MAISSPLKIIVTENLEGHGFKAKTGNWYLEKDETVLVVNLQKSQYGQQYYLNFGVSLKQLNAERFPKEQFCHIRYRLASLIPDSLRLKYDATFDLERFPDSDDVKKSDINSFLDNYGLPLLFRCATVNGIADAMRDGSLSKVFVHAALKNFMAKESSEHS